MRRLLLSFGLVLSVSAAVASSALAQRHHHAGTGAPEGAQKAPIFGPNPGFQCPGGAQPTPETFGFVVLNTPGDEMTVTGEVSLKHAKPNTEYVVANVQALGAFCSTPVVGTITTNRKGNGNLHFTDERFVGTTKFGVFVENATEAFISPTVELD